MSANTYSSPVAAEKASMSHETSHDVQDASVRLDQMKSDPRFARFFADSFDVSQYIRDLLASAALAGESRASSSGETREVPSAIQSRLDGSSSGEVSKAVTELGEVIKSQIVAYKKPLLRQAINVIQLDKWLSHVRQNVQDFNDHFAQVRTDLREPFDALSLQGKQISKAHQVSRTLRSVNLFMVQLSRLKRMLSPLPTSSSPSPSSNAANNDSSLAPMEISANLSYAASLIHELLSLVETERIRGIDIIDRELPWVSELKQLLEDRAIEWMSQLAPTTSKKTASAKFVPKHLDAATSNLITIPTLTEAIHILYSLHSLDTALKKVLENRMFLTSQQIQASLDVSTVKTTIPKYNTATTVQESTTSSSTATLAEQRRLALWSQLDTLFRDTFPSHLECLLTLHRALVSLWKRSQQQTPDDRSDKMRMDPLDAGSLPASMFEEPSFPLGENSSTLSYFLRRLIPKTTADLPRDMQALINATDAGSIVTYMWNEVVESEFCDSVLRATRKAKQTEQILSTDFPRFLRMFHAFAEHSSVVLERSGFSFSHLQRNYAMHMLDQSASEKSNNSPPSQSLSAASVSASRNEHSKQFHFVRRPTSFHHSTTEDVSASIPSSDNSSVLNLSKMELLIGNQLWTSISTRLQPIELEYQKILVAQFFTPINGMFAVSTTAPSTSTVDKSSLDKWQIFGPLGSGGKNQKGGVVVGGRLLLPGEVILALSSKSDSSTSSAFGRWVGGSPYICKWLSLVRSHFESLQSASPALVRVLLPKFLMALNKSIKLFILKTEEVVSHEEEASQISEMPPISQRFNAAVYNAIASVHAFFYKHIYSSIETQWSSHTTEPHMIDLAKALSSFSTLASQHILQPVFSRANNLISKCLFVDLHQTDWNNTSNTSSLYLRTLQRIISHLSSYILPLFSDYSKLPSQQRSSLLEAHCIELGTSIASDYILSISLIRHINDTTKMRIVSDATQVEQLCQQFEQLFADPSVDPSAPDQAGHDGENVSSASSKDKIAIRPASSALLHGFREVVFSDAPSLREAIQHISSEFLPLESRQDGPVQHSNLVKALKILFPASIWHLVLFRASAPENLSPHTQKNMSVRQYCDWLKKTPTQQVWNLFVWSIGEARKTPQLPEDAMNTFDLVEALGAPLMVLHDRVKEEK